MNIKRVAISMGAIALACVITLPSHADDGYPNKVIRIVNPYAAGGGSDVLIRLLSREMSAYLKQPIIVENKPGASGLIGSNAVRVAQPDGYTLLFTSSSALVGAMVKSPPPFDPIHAFSAVGRAVEYPLYVVVNPDIPAKNLREFAAYAKAQTKPLFHTSVGIGSTGHLACEQLALAGGFKLEYVPYNSVPAALQSVMTNQTQLMCDSVSGSQQYVSQGKLKGLAVMGKSRLPQVPGVPTTAEAGFPDAEGSVWLGLLAPRGTPAAVVSKLSKALHLALSSPDIASRAQREAWTLIKETPDEADASIAKDMRQWAEIIRIKQIKVTD